MKILSMTLMIVFSGSAMASSLAAGTSTMKLDNASPAEALESEIRGLNRQVIVMRAQAEGYREMLGANSSQAAGMNALATVYQVERDESFFKRVNSQNDSALDEQLPDGLYAVDSETAAKIQAKND